MNVLYTRICRDNKVTSTTRVEKDGKLISFYMTVMDKPEKTKEKQ